MGFDIYTGQNKGTGGLGRSLPCVLVHVEAKSGRWGGGEAVVPVGFDMYIYTERGQTQGGGGRYQGFCYIQAKRRTGERA